MGEPPARPARDFAVGQPGVSGPEEHPFGEAGRAEGAGSREQGGQSSGDVTEKPQNRRTPNVQW